eukprot:1827580-Rhodomonas_salina.2
MEARMHARTTTSCNAALSVHMHAQRGRKESEERTSLGQRTAHVVAELVGVDVDFDNVRDLAAPQHASAPDNAQRKQRNFLAFSWGRVFVPARARL